MDIKLLNKHLEKYKKLMDTDKAKKEYQERRVRIDYYRAWTKEKLLGMIT